MLVWVPLATSWDGAEIERFCAEVASGALHRVEAKKQLASALVATFHGGSAASAARAEFERVHQRGLEPENIEEVSLPAGVNLVDLLVSQRLAVSRSLLAASLREVAFPLTETSSPTRRR